ncbi:deoxynucleoside kinase [Candidatus Babeliales bacterium]|nr:deoxynucleoside kinase [Candidatus Babeliales bacterium]
MQKNKQSKKILVIEGNIGAGKSTFLKILSQKMPEIDPVAEPTNKWQKSDPENNLLDLFYKDTKRWAYTFQSYAFISRIQVQIENLKQNPDKNIQVLERSVFCDRYCFAKNCFESGTMTPLEWNIYKEWFVWLVENYAPKPTAFIYLKTDPEICYQRLQKRARSEEANIPLEYLYNLDKKHNDWLIDQKEIINCLKNIPILVLNCNEEFETNENVQNQHIEKIKMFLTNFSNPQIPPNYKNTQIQL